MSTFYNFNKDLEIGKALEDFWAFELENTYNHTNVVSSDCGEVFPDYDLKGEKEGKTYTYEVKYDASAYVYAEKRNRPANAFIEYKNMRHNKASGILSSKADYYVYFVRNGADIELYVIRRNVMLNKIFKPNGFPKYTAVETIFDNKSRGMLVPLTDIKEMSAFTYTYKGLHKTIFPSEYN